MSYQCRDLDRIRIRIPDPDRRQNLIVILFIGPLSTLLKI